MTHVLNEDSIVAIILALFTDRPTLNSVEIRELLPNESEDRVKNALARMRGIKGVKRIRVKGYLNILGRHGHAVPVFEVGTLPDVLKTDDNIEDSDELLRRARWVRDKREEHRLKKQLAELDAW